MSTHVWHFPTITIINRPTRRLHYGYARHVQSCHEIGELQAVCLLNVYNIMDAEFGSNVGYSFWLTFGYSLL